MSHTSPVPSTSSFLDQNDTILVVEKALDTTGQGWTENINIIEHFLIEIVEKISSNDDLLKVNFILRRLPTYTAPFANRNEYGILLNNFDFSLQPPQEDGKNGSIRSNFDKPGVSNFGQIEVYLNEAENLGRKYEGLVNERKVFRSHEIFQKFAFAFAEAYKELTGFNLAANEDVDQEWRQNEKVQIIGPHLLKELKCNLDVLRMFYLNQPQVPINKRRMAKCQISVNHLKSLITITLDGTQVSIRPCLFSEKGSGKINTNILERIPLFHPLILDISESLSKGFLLMPTSFETLWSIQCWPSESHLICLYQPNSMVGRILKLLTAFSLNPFHFWEILNNCFLIGIPDDHILQKETCLTNLAYENETSGGDVSNFSIEFLISSFLYELEKYPQFHDWCPSQLHTRLLNLLNSTLDSYEKGFHSNYFTKINMLRGLWKNHGGESSTMNIENLEKVENPQIDDGLVEIGGDDDDFNGFEFDSMDRSIDLTSDVVYKTNPFGDFEDHKKSQSLTHSKSKSLSKVLGAHIMRKIGGTLGRHSRTGSGQRSSSVKISSITPLDLENGKKSGKNRSTISDMASGFEESITQMRKEQTIQNLPDLDLDPRNLNSNSESKPCTSKSIMVKNDNTTKSIEKLNGNYALDGIYANIISVLSEPNLPDGFNIDECELIIDLDRVKKVLESQSELISCFTRVLEDTPRIPAKLICPHSFTSRQVQYLSLVIQKISSCSPFTTRGILHSSSKTTPSTVQSSWEISGDILRLVLHQMRSDIVIQTYRDKNINLNNTGQNKKFNSFINNGGKDKDRNRVLYSNGHEQRGSGVKNKFSFKSFKGSSDFCKNHSKSEENDETQVALENPTLATCTRLLEWLWQLRNSEIGRLSSKARRYLEELYQISLVNCHFLDQISDQGVFQCQAVKSACAVTRIMKDQRFPVHIPLLSASRKGWLWAEMILSLASWNQEKGFGIKAEVPLGEEFTLGEKPLTLLRNIQTADLNLNLINTSSNSKFSKYLQNSNEPDTDAITLAFHSEVAMPLGWYDFDDPRRPGPFAVPILIFSSIFYYNRWEIIPGNIVQVLLRLQKFNSLQHVGSMLLSPHRKTALSEVRKLNKSLSFRIMQFDDTVMSKTFKRLASLRATRRLLGEAPIYRDNFTRIKFYRCEDIGCIFNQSRETSITLFSGKEIQCTRL